MHFGFGFWTTKETDPFYLCIHSFCVRSFAVFDWCCRPGLLERLNALHIFIYRKSELFQFKRKLCTNIKCYWNCKKKTFNVAMFASIYTLPMLWHWYEIFCVAFVPHCNINVFMFFLLASNTKCIHWFLSLMLLLLISFYIYALTEGNGGKKKGPPAAWWVYLPHG